MFRLPIKKTKKQFGTLIFHHDNTTSLLLPTNNLFVSMLTYAQWERPLNMACRSSEADLNLRRRFSEAANPAYGAKEVMIYWFAA
jgi:hypothetical protein